MHSQFGFIWYNSLDRNIKN
uniref:Uncharacterized protein n=1 Tax=Rhizophora mucronata TaxID=61149 RepID=A0A2P2Q085_RHIMU